MFFRYCLKSMILKYQFRYCLKGLFVRSYENYSSRFPEGSKKQEIQQRRQARQRPREKEALNICLPPPKTKCATKTNPTKMQKCISMFLDRFNYFQHVALMYPRRAIFLHQNNHLGGAQKRSREARGGRNNFFAFWGCQ